MNKKKICKIAGVAVASAAIVAGGAFYGMQQLGVIGNSSNGSSSSLQSMVAQKLSATEDEHEVTLHFKWEGSQPHVAYSVDETNTSTTKPGVPMKDEGNGWYTYTIKNAEEADVVISVPEMDYTTSEFSRSEGEYWYNLDTGWYTKAPSNYEEPEIQKTYPADAPEKEVTKEAAAVAANSKITVHYPSDWDNTYIYAWNALPDDIEMDWPGQKLEKASDGYYSYTFDATTKVNFLFSGDGKQTDDFSIKEAGEYWYNNGKWENKKPGGTDGPSETDTPANTEKPSGPSSTPMPYERTDFRDETIYFVMTTRFYDGDPANNAYCWDDAKLKSIENNDPGWRGDFRGLVEKLDYIKALGFSAIWITPVCQNASGLDYHGYHANNFKKVDARYESDGYTYQDLINAAHEKDIKVIQDIVLNHTSNFGEENLFPIMEKDPTADPADIEACMKIKDPKGIMPSQEEYDAMNGDSQYGSRLEALKGDDKDTDFIYHHTSQTEWEQYSVQTGSIAGDCVDLDTENPIVSDYLIDAYNGYINMGVDAFRVDTVKHISRLTFNKEFIPAFKKTGGENFFIFGECCSLVADKINKGVPCITPFFYTWKESKEYAWTDRLTRAASAEQNWKDNESTANADTMRTSNNAFLEGNNYHEPDYSQNSGFAMIDFRMHHNFLDANRAFGATKESEDDVYNDSTWNVTYVDSHDYGPNECLNNRYNGGTAAWAENLSLMFTYRGIPCIYYGSEVEFMAGAQIDPRFNNSWLPYNESGRAYFGDYIEGDVETTDFAEYKNATGKMAETLNKPLAKHIQRLNKIRRTVPALCKGQYSTKDCNGSIAFKRRYTDDKMDSFVCVTISGDATFTGVPSGTYVDLVTGDKVECGGTLTAKCSGQGNMRVYVYQNETAKLYGANGKVGEDGAYLKQ